MKKLKSVNLLDIIPVITLAVIFLIFVIASDGNTITAYNLKNLVSQVVPVAIGSLGVIFVVALGSTDISVGASAALCSTIAAMLAGRISPWILIPLALVLSIAMGMLIGFIVTKFKMDSFMTTLAFLIAIKGLLNYVLTLELVYAPAELSFVTSFWFSFLILIILIVLIYFIFEHTKFGFYCKCIGENERTVRSVGVNVNKIRLICFALSGCMAGIFGFIQLCKVGGSTNTLCNMMEMRIQMAIFLGGVLVSGGFSAKLYKVLLGSITIIVIENGLTVCQVSSTIAEAVEGILLIVILCITVRFNNVSQKKSAEEAAKLEHA
ncbi:Ribose transport system permease protein rbsC [uncultured Roseburia sp.]|uniref:ABC transporter permease n=1 Tax=Brotonthovivens ammoniilytica TaxID=2981725 RepID=A0ABT2TGN9_9FIRM|nr:ABC transporter permease [Brotonthovivens ammoniilytica]MCU6761066.1 ABC transporter permease [Brotonthovivens ammoniilytica]SCI17893.1 Ribose transport system permease protein rbsC [uncultured Roseburia sp.]